MKKVLANQRLNCSNVLHSLAGILFSFKFAGVACVCHIQDTFPPKHSFYCGLGEKADGAEPFEPQANPLLQHYSVCEMFDQLCEQR